jgi:hypothetical protein
MKGSATPIKFHFVEVGFSQIDEKEDRANLNALPTSLQLNEDQVDKLLEVGRRLLLAPPRSLEFVDVDSGNAYRHFGNPLTK